MSDYNGYANRETWNVSLWLFNDETLYASLLDYISDTDEPVSYDGFVRWNCMEHRMTWDRVSFSDPVLDRERLTEILVETAEDM